MGQLGVGIKVYTHIIPSTWLYNGHKEYYSAWQHTHRTKASLLKKVANYHPWQLSCPEDAMFSPLITERLPDTVEGKVSPVLPCLCPPYCYTLISQLTFNSCIITGVVKLNKGKSAVLGIVWEGFVVVRLDGRQEDQWQPWHRWPQMHWHKVQLSLRRERKALGEKGRQIQE